jgi:uncharacterized protein (TIGR02588 family)
MATRSKQREEEPLKRRLEAIAAALGALMALGTIGVILWDAITGDGDPPVVVIKAREVYEHEDGYVLEIDVLNRGDETGSQVTVEGSLSRDGEVVEESETTFDYVPSRSRRRGGLFFSADPRTHDLMLRAQGYVNP